MTPVGSEIVVHCRPQCFALRPGAGRWNGSESGYAHDGRKWVVGEVFGWIRGDWDG
jgi:hypothetical protein